MARPIMGGKLGLWRHLVVLASVALCSLLALRGWIGTGDHPERFDAKQVAIVPAGEDGLRIREVVDQDFGNERRHGYERIIPNDFGAPRDISAGSPNANSDIGIADTFLDGTVPATRIRLGDPDTTYQNQHRYVLTYTLPDAQLDRGRLHLDVIGSGEELETGRFEIVVSGFQLADPTCDVGGLGTVGGCELTRDAESGDYRAVIEPLRAGDGITIGGQIIGFTSPTLPDEPPLPAYRADGRRALAIALIPLGIGVALLVLLVAAWRGRNEVFAGGVADAAFGPGASGAPPSEQVAVSRVSDAQLRKMATTEFVPPRGIDPWQGAVVLSERIDDDTVSAWFSGLAASEALTLRQEGKHVVIGLGRGFGRLEPAQQQLVSRMLGGRLEMTLGTYDPGFAAAWSEVKRLQGASIASSGWWKQRAPRPDKGPASNPLSVLVVLVVIFFVFGGSLASAAAGIVHSYAAAIALGALVPGFVAFMAYATLLPVRSATGSSLALMTESFRRFLAASEGRHVDWAWQQGLLREYSAWAVALGAATAWGDALSHSNVPPQELSTVNPLLVHSMHSSFHSSHTAPSSSGGSGGGGGGGGVGGGGGGGSSGSW